MGRRRLEARIASGKQRRRCGCVDANEVTNIAESTESLFPSEEEPIQCTLQPRSGVVEGERNY